MRIEENRRRKREKLNTMKENDENQDIISKLPNDLLTIILSKLQVDEAVRCNILSKRWLGLWKQTPHMEFNARHMIKPFTQLLCSRESLTNQNPDLIINRLMQKGISRYGINVFLSLHRHSGDISSCRFVHFQKSLEFGEVNTWINFLVNKKKGFKNLSLECVPNFGETEGSSKYEIHNPRFLHRIFYCLSSLELINYTIDSSSAFEDCHNLKVLKLKRITLDDATLTGILENCAELENFSLLESTGFTRLIIVKSKLQVLRLQAVYVQDQLEVVAQNLGVLFLDSIICYMSNVSIVAPNLQNFEYRWYSISRAYHVDNFGDILEYYNDLSEFPICNIFQNVSTMTLDLDLNEVEECIGLSLALRSCTSLQVLKITLPVYEDKDSTRTRCYYNLGYFTVFNSMFWEKQRNAIIQKMKFVYIKGFNGMEKEVQFVKFLITRGSMMKKITIICNDSTEEAESLLSLPRASPNLSIKVELQ